MSTHVDRFVSIATVSLFTAILVVAPSATSPAQTGVLKGDVVDGDGMHNTTFKTNKGDIIVHLPDDMAAGDTISGTVAIEPAGKTDGERAANRATLNGYVVESAKQSTKPGNNSLRWYLPRASTTADLILRDKDGNVIGQAEVPLTPRGATAPNEPVLPKLIVVDKPWVARGIFHPDIDDPKVTVNGESAAPLAESPRKIICENPSKKPGPQTITLQETPRDPAGGSSPATVARGVTNNLDLTLSAPKLKLQRGETTTLHVVVSGLEGIGGPVPLRLQNKSVTVLHLSGGDDQSVLIHSAEVKDGKYQTDRTLTGIQPGPFLIFAEVTPAIMRSENVDDKAIDDCLKLLKEANDLDAQALKPRGQAAEFRDKARAAKIESEELSAQSASFRRAEQAGSQPHAPANGPSGVMAHAKKIADELRADAAKQYKLFGNADDVARLRDEADAVEAQGKGVSESMKRAGVGDPPIAGDAERLKTAALAREKEAQTYKNLADKLTKEADQLNAQANAIRDRAVCKSAA